MAKKMIPLDRHRLSNGLLILGERMDYVRSVSFNILTPGGAALLPDGCCGAGSVLCDWLFRGAGTRSSRQLIDALDGLGVHHNAGVNTHHLTLSGALEAGNLEAAIDLYADILLSPRLEPEQFEPARDLAVQELAAMDDDPRSKVMMLLHEQYYPDPLGRPGQGKPAELEALTISQAAAIAAQLRDPSRLIFSIAGCYDFDTVCRQLERRLGELAPLACAAVEPTPKAIRYTHHPSDGAQVHIGLMTAIPPISAGQYYETMAAVTVLSGSMSSRLFTEVREKRGLCYAVGARYHTLRDWAGVSCYAGTTPDKSQQTLEVTWEQFLRLKDGITEDELQRAKVGLKSSLIMQSESSGSRAAGIAGDHYLLGRVRPLEEIRDAIESLTVQSVGTFLQNNPFETFTAVTIGPKEIQV